MKRLDPTMPRDGAGNALNGGNGGHHHNLPPKSQPPEQGWREGLQQCNFKPRGVRCKNVAMPARTLCSFHDPKFDNQRRYQSIASRDHFAEALRVAEGDKTWADMRKEINVMQATVDRIIAHTNDADPAEMRELLDDLEKISKRQEANARIEVEKNAVWDAATIRAFGVALGQLVNRCVRDERDRKALADGVQNLLSGEPLLKLTEIEGEIAQT